MPNETLSKHLFHCKFLLSIFSSSFSILMFEFVAAKDIQHNANGFCELIFIKHFLPSS